MTPTPSNTLTCASAGDLISSTTRAYKDKLEQVIREASATDTPGWSLLEMDLRAARFIDSVGINLIILMIRRMKERGCSVRILIGSANLQRVLLFMRVDQHAEIVLG